MMIFCNIWRSLFFVLYLLLCYLISLNLLLMNTSKTFLTKENLIEILLLSNSEIPNNCR